MTKDEAEKLIDTIRGFIAPAPGDTRRALPAPAKLPTEAALKADIIKAPDGHKAFADQSVEALYLMFKNRLIDEARFDPALVQLLMVQPEIVVGYERQVVTLDAGTMRGRVARLMAQGFLAETRKTGTVRAELARTGADPGGGGGLGQILDSFVRDGFLVRDGDGFKLAPGVKVTERELVSS